jgi:hypothetical protein
MPPRSLHKAARLLTTVLTVAAAAFGSIAGFASSGWGGAFVIIPVSAAIFAILGALIGGAIEFALRMKYPTDYEI